MDTGKHYTRRYEKSNQNQLPYKTGRHNYTTGPLPWPQNTKKKEYQEELNKCRNEIITDINADFPTRLGRYVKIKLLKYLLNQFYK